MPNYRSRHTMRTRPYRMLWVEMCEDGTTGGTHQMLLDFARHLDRDRFQLVALFYEINRFAPLLRELGVEVIDFSAERERERAGHRSGEYFRKLRSILGAPFVRARLLRRYSIDLLYLVNNPGLGYDDWLPAARLVRIPSVACSSGPYLVPRGPIRRWLTRRHSSFVSLSDYVTQTLVVDGIPKDRIQLIYPGVDVEGFRRRVARSAADVRKELRVDQESVLVVMVGNVRHWKGQDIVLAALERIPRDRRARLRLCFVGAASTKDADYLAGLQARVSRAGLQDSVTFLGSRSDVPDLLNAADIALHASRVPEPFGIVVVEAMAMGKPAIATAFGGPAEVLTPTSGRTFRPDHPEELADVLDELATSVELRASLGAAALQRVKKFDARLAADAIQQVCERALAARKGSRRRVTMDSSASPVAPGEYEAPQVVRQAQGS